MRIAVIVLFLLVGAVWVALYLSSHGVLVRSEEVPAMVYFDHTDFGGGPAMAVLPTGLRTCTYIVARGLQSLAFDVERWAACPRLWNFGQYPVKPKSTDRQLPKGLQ